MGTQDAANGLVEHTRLVTRISDDRPFIRRRYSHLRAKPRAEVVVDEVVENEETELPKEFRTWDGEQSSKRASHRQMSPKLLINGFVYGWDSGSRPRPLSQS